MATAAERMRRHRDRKRRGVVAVVPIEVTKDWLELIDCCTDLRLDDYADGDYSAIPMDVLRNATQEFVTIAVDLATAIDE